MSEISTNELSGLGNTVLQNVIDCLMKGLRIGSLGGGYLSQARQSNRYRQAKSCRVHHYFTLVSNMHNFAR